MVVDRNSVLSKMKIMDRNFGLSRITAVSHNFGPSKVTAVDRDFGPSKITVVDLYFGSSNIFLDFFYIFFYNSERGFNLKRLSFAAGECSQPPAAREAAHCRIVSHRPNGQPTLR